MLKELGFQTSKVPVTQGPAHPEMVSDAGHEPGLPDEVKLQPDLGGQLVHRGGQIKSELCPLQEDGSAPNLDQVSSHGWQSSWVLDLDRHQSLRSQARKLLLRLSPMNLHIHVTHHPQKSCMGV